MNEVHLTITGRVQGVNFRKMATHKAQSLKLTGTVKNQADGSVHALIQGTKKNIYSLINWMHTNPGLSLVEGIRARWSPPHTQYKEFTILRESTLFADQTQSITNLGKRILR